MNPFEQKQIAAGRTLEKLGYTGQGGELWKPPLGANSSPLLTRIAQLQAEVEALRKDSARLDWIIDNASSRGGGNGFTLQVFIPVDCECVRTAIDTAIAKDTQALPEPLTPITADDVTDEMVDTFNSQFTNGSGMTNDDVIAAAVNAYLGAKK